MWNLPLLWEGFVKCCEKTVPDSFQVILLLPPERLLTVLESHPNLKLALQQHVTALGQRQRSFMSQQVLSVVQTGRLSLPAEKDADTVVTAPDEDDGVNVMGLIAPLISHNGSRVQTGQNSLACTSFFPFLRPPRVDWLFDSNIYIFFCWISVFTAWLTNLLIYSSIVWPSAWLIDWSIDRSRLYLRILYAFLCVLTFEF